VFFDRDLIVAGSAATAAADTTSLRRYTLSSGFFIIIILIKSMHQLAAELFHSFRPRLRKNTRLQLGN
jgi:hypothetical protein